MSVIGSNILAGASGQGGGYNLTRSLRFRSSASAYLNRTPASAGNRKTWTWSGWVKRGNLDHFPFISCDFAANNSGYLRAGFGGNTFSLWLQSDAVIITNQVFRDPAAWYHMVVAVDTTQATAANRYKVYVNGSEITSFSYDNRTIVSQNTDLAINSTNNTTIGYANFAGYADGYLTEVNFIDGQALTPSSFGETSTTTGVWQPKKYAGTYGTNGFYLPFTDNSALTTSSNVGLGKDFSGNGNYWTTNNISITSGATYDSMTDVPTLTSATASNFCTLNPLWYRSSFTFSNANLTGTSSTANSRVVGTIGADSGKYYAEVTATGSQTSVGIIPIANAITTNTNEIAYFNLDGNVYKSGVAQGSAAATWGSGDVIGIALNLDSQEVSFYKNNTFQKTVSLATDSNWTFEGFQATAGSSTAITFNFGQRPFAYTPPTGFVALNTFNLPTPTIGATASTQAGKYFNSLLYTGNSTGGTAITGLGFSPDLVWIKSRSNAYDHELADSVRGATRTLQSNNTSGEFVSANYLQSFDSDGFTLGNWSGGNNSGSTYVSWSWRGSDSSAVTNTAGSITSTVSANTSSGFSVVTYTGTGSNATVGHGLGVAPKMIIAKCRGAASQWAVYHSNVDATPQNYTLLLNSTAAKELNSLYWNNTAPTSTVVSLGGSSAANTSGQTQVMYCFSEIQGYSKFGSYSGITGNADSSFIYTGFKPAFLLIKRTDSTGFWVMLDNKRKTYNVNDAVLYANSSNAEATGQSIDFLSNGFKLRTTDSDVNTSGNYVYAAFAENPFKYSLAE